MLNLNIRQKRQVCIIAFIIIVVLIGMFLFDYLKLRSSVRFSLLLQNITVGSLLSDLPDDLGEPIHTWTKPADIEAWGSIKGAGIPKNCDLHVYEYWWGLSVRYILIYTDKQSNVIRHVRHRCV